VLESTESVERQLMTQLDGAGRVTMEELVVQDAEHACRATAHCGNRVQGTVAPLPPRKWMRRAAWWNRGTMSRVCRPGLL
jgi:hypothetical protein